ncbi:MAG: U32 family peptidase [Oscillospiraceae bacterium]|nr:U32 family peptidase [Oscillospiraceae bacterium]
MIKKPEILSPAGDMEKLRAAVLYGADAVYLAGEMFGMRTASQNFSHDELEIAVGHAHKNGVKVYVTCNTLMRNHDLKLLPGYLEMLGSVGVDGIIVADLGCMRLAQKYAPSAEIHISTQASVLNRDAANAWYELGAARVCLAREASLSEISEIVEHKNKNLQIEAFVHGAMCMAYSGRCMISDYLAGRSSNRGNCAQPCRWKYALVEEKRPGEYYPVVEDEHGTHIFNSKDMNMVSYIPELIGAGIDSFKIEGRVKSAYYCAAVTNAYRLAVDEYAKSPDTWERDGFWLTEVNKVSHREYCTGFYFGEERIQRTETSNYIRTWDVVASVVECDDEGNAVLEQKNKFDINTEYELMQPRAVPQKVIFEKMINEKGEEIDSARQAKIRVRVKLPTKAPVGAFIRREGSRFDAS